MKIIFKISLVISLLALVACSKNEKLTISGTISAADGDTLIIQSLQKNVMTILDSKVLKKDGKFKFTLDKTLYPEYYFLQVNRSSQLVIIRDSFDLITINAKSDSLINADIKGSELSIQIQKTALRIAELRVEFLRIQKAFDIANEQEKKELSSELLEKVNLLKKDIGMQIYQSPRSYYSYYALYQRLTPEHILFSPYDESDYGYFAAAATAYNVFQKEDPRTKALYDLVEDAVKAKRMAELQKMVSEASGDMPDIVMNDYKGVERKLSDLKGKIVILNFWASVNEDSRLFNQELLKLYNKYKSRGVTVFQVSADKSKILWEEAIEQDQLPWINVCDFKVGASQPIMLYNVQQLPATFLIGRDGVLDSKQTTISDLEKAIKSML